MYTQIIMKKKIFFSLLYIKLNRKQPKNYMLLLIDDVNNSVIYASDINKYYITHNQSIYIRSLDKFRYINKSNKINAIDTSDNYYNVMDTSDNYFAIKSCTILLIDDNDHSKIFISKKNSYFNNRDREYLDTDDSDYEVNKYEFFEEDYNDYDDCYYDEVYDDIDQDDDDYLYYKRPFNDFESLISIKNNIVNQIDNNNHNNKINLPISHDRICIH